MATPCTLFERAHGKTVEPRKLYGHPGPGGRAPVVQCGLSLSSCRSGSDGTAPSPRSFSPLQPQSSPRTNGPPLPATAHCIRNETFQRCCSPPPVAFPDPRDVQTCYCFWCSKAISVVWIGQEKGLWIWDYVKGRRKGCEVGHRSGKDNMVWSWAMKWAGERTEDSG